MSFHSPGEVSNVARHAQAQPSEGRPADSACARRFRDLHELNRRFLALLIAGHSRPFGTDYWLPDTVRHGLARLGEAELNSLAGCPYALFDLDGERLRFDAYPRAVAARAREPAFEPHDPNVEFARAALFFAWHAAQTDPVFARLALGLEDRGVHWLAALPVTMLGKGLAERVLAPCWPHHPTFWPDLVRFAGTSHPSLPAAQWLGCLLRAGRSHKSLTRLELTPIERSRIAPQVAQSP